MRGGSNQMRLDMRVVTSNWSRTYVLASEMQGRDKTLVRVQEPVKRRGEGYLKLRFQLWSYIPQVERTLLIPPSSMLQPFLGSDFSYDDLVRASRWDEDYEQKLAGKEDLDGQRAVIIELVPKPEAPVVYGRLKLWLREEDSVPLKEEFYDEKGVLLKTLRLTEILPKGGHTIPTRWGMTNHLKEGRQTLITVLEAQYDLPLDESRFTKQQLERIEE